MPDRSIQDEAILSAMAEGAALFVTKAILEAGLEAEVTVERADSGYNLLVHSTLPRAQHIQAEDIAQAALESYLIQVSNNAHLH